MVSPLKMYARDGFERESDVFCKNALKLFEKVVSIEHYFITHV